MPGGGLRRGPGRGGAGRGGRAGQRPATEFPAHDAVGEGRGPAGPARSPAGPQRARGGFGGTVVRRPLRRRGVRPRLGDRLPASHGGARRPGRTRPRGGLLQRQPGVDRGCAAFAGDAGRAKEGRAARSHGRARRRERSGAPAHGADRRGAGDRGRGLPDQPLRLGPGARRRGRRRAHGDARARGRAPREGQPGGAPRGRGARRTERRPGFSRWLPTRSAAAPRRGSPPSRGSVG